MVLTYLAKYKDAGILILRLGVGILFIRHGAPKLCSGPEQWNQLGGAMGYLGITFLPTVWGFMAASAELFGGICLILGIFTRTASALLFLTMVVATVFHLGQGQGIQAATPAIENGIIFLSLICIGPGKYSLEALLCR
ncbi:MAG: DoxX family protein [Candidatus Omnitrophica bacterium]|nr:DoxX family protein [Candidatus Omnitrophota bacterium]